MDDLSFAYRVNLLLKRTFIGCGGRFTVYFMNSSGLIIFERRKETLTMFIRIAICAIFVSMLATSASATFNQWGDWGQWDGWEQSENDTPKWDRKDVKKKLKKIFKKYKKYTNKKWCNWDCEQWEQKCNWGKERDCEKKDRKCKKNKKRCKKKKNNCDPSAVPTPTAAVAGLGMMGMMLVRRRRSKLA